MPAKKVITNEVKEEETKPKKTITKKQTTKVAEKKEPKTTTTRTRKTTSKTDSKKDEEKEVKPRKTAAKSVTKKDEKKESKPRKTASKSATKNDAKATETKNNTKTTETKKTTRTTKTGLQTTRKTKNATTTSKPKTSTTKRVESKTVKKTNQSNKSVEAKIKPEMEENKHLNEIKKDVLSTKPFLVYNMDEDEDNQEEKEELESSNIEEEKILSKKDDKKITRVKLSRIEKEIKKQKTISKEKENKINKRIFRNILIANFVVLYFIFAILGYNNLESAIYVKLTHVLSIVLVCSTIGVFEMAYKKDNDEIALHGIEMLALSIITILTIYISMKNKVKYTCIINSISMLFATYYVGKSIIIYCKMKKKALKRTSDIQKIRRIQE